MKRLRVILLFLLLGAIVNVAVAWGIAWQVAAPGNTGNPLSVGFTIRDGFRKLPNDIGRHTHWIAHRIEKVGTRLIVVTAIGGRGPSSAPFNDLLPPGPSIRRQIEQRDANVQENVHPGYYYWDGRGWPFISLHTSWPWFTQVEWPNIKSSGGFSFGKPTDPYCWPYGVHQLRSLPYRPLWPGFIANMVFYAMILWLLIPGPFVLRRFIRRKRGLCVKCAYDLRGADHEACPECGEEIRKGNPA